MSLEQMIHAIDQNKKQISEDIAMFRFLTEDRGADVTITISASIPTHRAEDGTVLHRERRNCHIDTINQTNDEDIEALKGILCRNVGFIKMVNAGLANAMISMLQEDADQESGDK